MKRNYLKKTCLAGLTVVLLSTLTACALSDTSNEISEPAKRVIEAMMTAPNEELFNPDGITNIGLEAEFSPEDSDKSAEAWDEMEGNWEKEVGDCFAEGKLDEFLTEGPGTLWLGNAYVSDTEVSVGEMTLQEKSENTEQVLVNLQNGGETEEVLVTFQYDNDSLITSVIFEEQS